MTRSFGDLVGETIIEVDGAHPESLEVTLTLEGGARVVMEHHQDCCESVRLVDVAGDVSDLVGSPLVLAEEVGNADAPAPEGHRSFWADSYTWTFYKMATVKGHVTMRWLGESNGYYSEAVDVVWHEPAESADVPDVYPAHVAEIVYGHSRSQLPHSPAPEWEAKNDRWRWWVAFDWNDSDRLVWEAP